MKRKFFFPSQRLTFMSKRVNHPNEKPPAKRARGFRLARSNSDLESTASSSASSSSLFVTVNPHDQHSGTLSVQSRLISRSLDSSAHSLSPTPENEPQIDVTLDSSGPMEDIDPTHQQHIPPKPKRKRFTTNVVCGGLPLSLTVN
jgi:hypothetical protein